MGTFAASSGWARLYNLTFIVGLFIGFTVFVVLNMVFPVPGLGEERPFRANGSTYEVGDPESPTEVESKIQ